MSGGRARRRGPGAAGLLGLLLSATALASPPPGPGTPLAPADWVGVRVATDSGAVPPPWAFTSELTLRLTADRRGLDCAWRRTPQYREGLSAAELFAQGARPHDTADLRFTLDRSWAEELQGLLARTRLCPVRRAGGADGLPGGGGRTVLLLGEGGATRAIALRPGEEGSALICEPAQAEWERLLVEARRAAGQRASEPLARTVRWLTVDPAGRASLLELRLDHETRSLRARLEQGASPAALRSVGPAAGETAAGRELGREALRTLQARLAAPSWYAEGDAGPAPSAPGRYLDRGEGRYYRLPDGVRDALGRAGAVAALQAWLALQVRALGGS